ncbi:restriction endonuclease subunit S [Caloramator proteoclasticus]|uniref:Type I restriction enzyme, S subunit n=1 Tax=Caloramator proteoclasticus DSM 10124 TaxID=1121262 RepID=A0A1M4UMZ7_9CLOT|nr:restriction endonuclease subunit S [Caloramator proteoclasticus]SHE58096.1 type I restriction enzyme, S subunit [Caloramator proteoclasticus DSM 10124]
MRYKRYEKYKDSGIEWIGEVPEGWEIDKLKKSIVSLKNGIWGDEPQNDENDIYCIRVADFNRDNFEIEDKEFTIRNFPKEKQREYLLNKGDLLIEKSGGGEKQPVGFVVRYNLDKKAIYANFMAKMILDKKYADSNYFKYLHSVIYSKRINVRSIKQTTGIQNLDTNYYFQEYVVYPPINEQIKIANYLDQKTSEIDSLIQDKEKLISLLEEKRQAIITEAVTKGLNPNVKMKDSGIEWIGEIPEHWEVKPLKRIFKIVNGGTPNSSRESYWNGEIVWVTPNDLSKLTEVYIKNSERKITEDGLYNCSARIVSRGSIIISTRAPIGYVAIAGVDLCTNQGCKSLVAIKKANPKYFYYWIFSINFYLNALGQGTTFMELSNDNLSMVGLLIPPICEQEEIANFLDKKTSEIDSLINDIKQQIQKLKEYRQSLIFEAVTGKIDLRDITLQ